MALTRWDPLEGLESEKDIQALLDDAAKDSDKRYQEYANSLAEQARAKIAQKSS